MDPPCHPERGSHFVILSEVSEANVVEGLAGRVTLSREPALSERSESK